MGKSSTLADALLEVVARYEGSFGLALFDDEGAARAAVAAELRRLRSIRIDARARGVPAPRSGGDAPECHATNLQRELLQTAADKQKGRTAARRPIDELGQDVYRVDYLLSKRDKDARVHRAVGGLRRQRRHLGR